MTAVMAKEITDTVLDIIRENLEQGNDVFLEGFGAFRIKERKARNRLNIKKMRKVKYPPKLYVIFVPSARLEEAVKNLKQDEGASGKEEARNRKPPSGQVRTVSQTGLIQPLPPVTPKP
jgi:nucleoid DNA-binding protein